MTYNPQLGHAAAANSPYRQQQNQYIDFERPHTAGSARNPQFQNFGRAQNLQRGYYGNDSNEIAGQRGEAGIGEWSEGRLGRERRGKPPFLQTGMETGRDPNLSPQAAGASRSYPATPDGQFRKTQYDRNQHEEQFHISNRDRVLQPPQGPPQRELPIEPSFDYGPNDHHYNMRVQNFRVKPPMKPSMVSEWTADYQGGEEVRRQDYAEVYRQELFEGKGDLPSGDFGQAVSRSHPGDGRAQVQSSWPHQGQSKNPTQKRVLARPPSPEGVSWDNPFPVFGARKKNTGLADGMNLSNSMSRIRLDNSSFDPNNVQRPHTASSKSSQTSSRVGQRRLDESDVQQTSSSVSRKPSDRQFEVGVTRPPPGRLGHRTSTEPPAPQARHSEDTSFRPSLEPNVMSDFNNRRSRTMPSNISRVAHDFRSRGEYDSYNSQPEPSPNSGQYGQESVDQLNTKFSTKISHGMAYQSGMRSHEGRNVTGIDKLPLRNLSSFPHHSAHNSLGEVYDSYYHESAYEIPKTSHETPHEEAESFDEDMPNFDAVPANGMGHRRGMTIDEHLKPQVIPSDSSQKRAGGQRKHPPDSHQNTNIAGQFNRSKSQPNLKEQRSDDTQSHHGFDFGLATDTPPIPLISSQRETSPHQETGPAGYSDGRSYIAGQHGRSSDLQQGVPAGVAFNGGVGSNGSHQKAFQSRPSLDSSRFPPSQGDLVPPSPRNASTGGGTPGNTISSTSTPMNHPNNADVQHLHPTPIRPGLMQDTLPFQITKPPSMRHFDSGVSTQQHQNPISTQAAPVPSNSDRQSKPVTHDELDKLRQAVKSKPSDQKMQLLLAKKLVEASSLLADDGGRADPKTTMKNRERYTLDAHKIVKKLVSGHSTEATFYLADCYSCGHLGLEADPREAFVLYQTAAKAGHGQSAYRVAVCYEMGQEDGGGTRRDPNKAVQWYQRAATLGDTPAMYKLGVIQLKGLLGQPRNPKEALKWLQRAADQANEENPHALHELGLLYEGAGPKSLVNTDVEYSKQLFTRAANLGYKFSQFRLGCAYEYGLMGCLIDPRQSISWYSKAAIQEEHQSELALSGWYLTGSEGVLLQSDTEAYLWARKAAQAGVAKAEYAMGYFTEVGIGVPANLEDAKRWYWRSASQNFPKARERLEALRKGGAKMEKSRVSRSAIRKQTEGDCKIM